MGPFEVIILAGGYGTRLRRAVADVPKPMADINGKPFLELIMEYLIKQNVNKVVLSVGYKHEVITRYFGSMYKGVSIQYVKEESPLGTGGALREALKKASNADTFVINGDTFFSVPFEQMFDFHKKSGALLTLGVKPMKNSERYGAVVMNNSQIIGFDEKPNKKGGYINGGVYIVNESLMNFFPYDKDVFSFECDFLSKDVHILKPRAFVCDGYFIDIGVPEDYEKAKQQMNLAIERTKE